MAIHITLQDVLHVEGGNNVAMSSRGAGMLGDKYIDGEETSVAAGDKCCSGGTDNLSEEERDTVQVRRAILAVPM